MQDYINATCRDINPVDLLKVEVNPRKSEVTSTYKACHVGTVSLD